MALSEADTRAKLIDPAIHACGWTEDLICRETTLGAVEIIAGKARRRSGGRTDYTLRVRVSTDSQPVAMALLEAKKDTLPPGHGLDQVKGYLAASRHNVQFVFSSNGYLFVEFDRSSGMTNAPRPLSEFPSPADLRARYEKIMGFSLEEPLARPLLARYQGGEGQRRYFQDAAIRAVFEKVARSAAEGRPPRALLSLATGTGKTFIACHLLKRIADAGQLKRALFLCDRDELRTQGLKAMQGVFGADAAEVYEEDGGRNHAKNARVHIATYQTLGIDRDDGDAFVKTKRKLTDECDLWCILSLPGGVFSAAGAGVKTNLLFFTKGKPTERIWYYDLSDVKVGKKTPLTLKHFEDFAVKLATREDSERSWTVDLLARRAKAAIDAQPFKDTARAKS